MAKLRRAAQQPLRAEAQLGRRVAGCEAGVAAAAGPPLNGQGGCAGRQGPRETCFSGPRAGLLHPGVQAAGAVCPRRLRLRLHERGLRCITALRPRYSCLYCG